MKNGFSRSDYFLKESPRQPSQLSDAEIAVQFDAIKREGGHAAIARACQVYPEIQDELIRRWVEKCPGPQD
jgi:hypothetical protein